MVRSVLSKVNSPADLKDLSREELNCLASEIRELIVETTSANGGHLASSLGAVEVAIAVHRAFNAPLDKIIWDVGHQAYAHKIITGRRQSFRTLRQKGGVSGFPRRSESPYDLTDSGHSGGSISYGVGLALSRELTGDDYGVVVIVGDGSMTSGVAYEAMNQAGHHLSSNFVIILNDNEMSISKNVGGFASYLSRIRIKPTYTHVKKEIESILGSFPGWGEAIYRVITNVKASISHALLPGLLFEAIGLKYVGPIDGHNIKELEQTLLEARKVDGPVLIHAITRKGFGYPPAAEKPDEFHGVGPFDKNTGSFKRKEGNKTYTELFSEAIVRIGAERKKLVAITAAMKLGTGLDKFSKRFPERFFDVGIAEQFAVNLAAGFAIGGLQPIVAIYSTFLQRAFDQISQEVCLQNLPVVFAVDRAGLVGEDGSTHHGYFDISYLRVLPNMTVMAPGDGRELELMLNYALQLGFPAAVRFPRTSADFIEGYEPPAIVSGTGVRLKDGSDVVLVAIGDMTARALEASEMLEKEGVSAGVVNARFAKPLDPDFFTEVCRGKRLVLTLENNSLAGGFGSALVELLCDCKCEARVVRKGIPDRYIEHGSVDQLIDEIGLSPEKICKDVIRALHFEHDD